MSDKLRLFVAVTIPPDRLEAVDRALEPLKPALGDARWVPVANQHVTLKFLGWVGPDLVEPVHEVCARVARSHAAARVSLAPMGTFPGRTRVRVLWAGLDDEASLLTSLAAGLDSGLERLGFAAETRPFTPHLTVARLRRPKRLEAGLPVLPDEALRPFEVRDLHLFRSHLSPRGARYEAIAAFPLGPEAGDE